MDSLKDPILAGTVGMSYQPIAKVLSVLTTLLVVCLYDYLTSVVSKINLFYVVASSFGMIFFVMASYLADPNYGLENQNRNPNRYLGWCCFFAIEAYGSLMVALFWSFTNSIMDIEQAKGAYGLIISVAQFGAIAGSTMATHSRLLGVPKLFLLSAISVLSITILLKVYSIVFRDDKTVIKSRLRIRSSSETHINLSPQNVESLSLVNRIVKWISQTWSQVFGGFYEGLSMIVKYPYVFYILGVASADEIILTLLDYQFKLLGEASSKGIHVVPPSISDITDSELMAEMLTETVNSLDSTVAVLNTPPTSSSADSDRFVNLLGQFGQLTNILSFIVSFFGFSYLVHRIGVRRSLMILPVFLFIAVIVTNLVNNMWVMFVFVSISKSLIFSLHDPVKEILYMPTSDAIKYKAAAWIDVFGCRFAKAIGSFIANFANGDVQVLRRYSEIPCIVVAIVFMAFAYKSGVEYDYLTEHDITVGNEDDDAKLVHGDAFASIPMSSVIVDEFGNRIPVQGKSVQDDPPLFNDDAWEVSDK